VAIHLSGIPYEEKKMYLPNNIFGASPKKKYNKYILILHEFTTFSETIAKNSSICGISTKIDSIKKTTEKLANNKISYSVEVNH
jgi:hypothetical protein